MKFINTIAICAVIFFAYRFNWILGIVVTLLLIAFGIYKYLPLYYRLQGKKHFANADYVSAKNMFKKAVDTGHANADTKMEYSYVLLRTGDIDEAEQVVNNLLAYKIKPEYRGRAIIQRCMCYYKKGNFDEAYNDAMELYNDGYRSIMLYGMIGYFKIVKDALSDDTFNFCMEAYEYADDDRDIRDNMAICYYNRGEYEKAKEISDKVLEDQPKFVEAWYHAAQIDNKLGLYKDGLEKLEHIKDCNRSFMTTISEQSIDELREELVSKIQ